ncbi:PKD domain-containing protein [Methanosarcina sp.]|uniref:PKD domain-containing protein n=1 Tax=Methanosarcina sp. TaxID=2213 RepID=UPI0029888D29|nr:PKD domain-containing protein [Methanosarcina sp.]MDW5551992.1 PKD domain-containing protein [Methanosarcina sp.]MDW5555754.1 PKD domain-containing protein [Methanosarcina sp.]MDW5561298.1 PKD domain-containing protein [Methanosarcina sp.]
MKGKNCVRRFRGQTLNKVLGITVLTFLMLVSIAGALPFAYITNSESNSVSVIDATTNKVTTTIPVGSNPIGVTINPNGTKVYVVNARSSDISVIDTATNSVVATVRAGNFPQGIVVSPNGKKVYVTNRYSNNVSVIDTGANTVVSTLNTGKSPAGVAVSPDGKKLYVTNYEDNAVSIFDTTTKTVITTISVGRGPKEIAVTPDGTRVYVANSDSESISVIDTATNSVTNTLTVGGVPSGVTVNPDGKKVYVTNNDEYFSTVSVIDTVTNKITAAIPVGSGPMGIAVTPDGKKVYVAISFYNTVSVIDTATNAITATVLVENSPYASGQFIGSIPIEPVYPLANFSSNITSEYVFPSVPVQFTDLSKDATKWVWDFGDGSGSTKQNPAHTYSATGIYTVSLTVSNPNGTDSKLATVNVVPKSFPAPSYAFITNLNSNTVSVINTGDNTLTATVPVGTEPFGAAVSPDGTKVYVTNTRYGNRGTVSVIDTAINKVTAIVDVGYKYSPCGIAVAPDGKKLYVADRDIKGVSVIDTFTNTVIATVPVGVNPLGVAITPDGKKVYVTNRYSNTVSVIDTNTNAVIATVEVGSGPCGVTVNQMGTVLYVTNCESNTISIVDTSTDTVTATVPVGEWPMGVTVTPDGTKVYVADEGSNNVSVIDTATKNVIATVKVGKNPYGIAVTPDGTKIYVANSGDSDNLGSTASVIDTVTDRVISTVNTGFSPTAFGQFIGPLPAQPDYPVVNFSSNLTSGYAPLSVQFTDFSKNADGWNWNFGDKSTSTQQNPVYIYSRAGNYNVTLTVNNKNGTDSKIATITVLAQPGFSVSPISGKSPLSVSFTDQSTGSPASWKWDFGDGTNSTEKNPVHIYRKSGKYSVTLTLNETGNKTEVTKSSYMTISNGYEAPIAAFSASTTSGKTPLSISFTDQSTGSPTSTKWTFGDGTYSTGKNPVHTYSKAGLYSITLAVSNADGSSTLTKTGYILVSNVLNPPVPGFSASLTSGIAPLTVDFIGQSTGPQTERKWSFGDGNTSTEKNPVHTFNKSGLYSVTLTASDEIGSNALTKTGYIAVSSNLNIPVTSFSASPTSGKSPLTVSFTGQSTGSPASWKWNFGDGSNSTEKNPVHTYNESGLYSVKLTASNSNGSNALTKTGYIAVVSNVSNTSVTSFSASPTSGKVPLTVNFTDKSTGKPTSWKWTFGDGDNSTEVNLVHTYNKSGNYTVALTTTSEGGSDKVQKSNYISVVSVNGSVVSSPDHIVPVTAFSATPTAGSMPLTVSFTDQSTGSPASWRWAFGDGTTSADKNPVHTYNKSGRYTVTLTASNANGSNALTKTGYIFVSNILAAPVTSYFASPASGSMPLVVRFTGQSTGAPTAWRWAFGDGNTSTEKNPVHTYNKSGRYTVTLTASNANGSNALTKSSYIAVSSVLAAPAANFSASPISGKAPLAVGFTDQSTGSPNSWKWDFGDGNNSTEKTPVHTYNESGLYSVKLAVSNSSGSNALTKTNYIAVSGILNAPVTSFSASPTSGKTPLTVSFTDQSTGSPTSWRWVFGDGNTSTEKNPVHTYNKSGLYSVTLTASNSNGSNALTRTGYIAVSNSLAASFSASPGSGPAPLNVSFTEQSTGLPTSWKWDFGDGNTSTEKNPVYMYNKIGRYTVSLTVNNSESISTETRSRYIVVNN